MIQLEKFVGGGVADTNYLYPARWGWININYLILYSKDLWEMCSVAVVDPVSYAFL